MDYLLICLTAFVVSMLTLIAGFGFGTLLMPVFAIFFPLPIAIATTAVIHLANNLFKFLIVGRFAKRHVVIRFGIPAGIAAILGALLLGLVAKLQPITSYHIGSYQASITYVGITIGIIVITMALTDLIPWLMHLSFPQKYLPLGGLLSGFFGGISGFQGMLRSSFLIKSGLTKEQYIGTGVVCSIIVDGMRLLIYGWLTYAQQFAPITRQVAGLIVAASLAAFSGAFIGSQMMRKIAFRSVQLLVGILLLVLGVTLAIGII
jgi:uncharacterized protein